MKTVGIITVHRLPNWGSALQAYALFNVIKSLGYNPEIIDYEYPNPWQWSRGGGLWRLSPISIRTKIARLIGYRPLDLLGLNERFIKKEMKLSAHYKTYESIHKNPPIYDIYCTGSDQIWNYKTIMCDTVFMLDFAPEQAKRIAYSSSFSVNEIPVELEPIYREHLGKFSAISVRESHGSKIIKDILGYEASVVLDPTLLLTDKEWGKLAEKANFEKCLPHKYILCYMIGYTYDPNEAMSELLKNLQNYYQCPIIIIGNKPKPFDGELYNFSPKQGISVYEFISLIKNAAIVVTSSFHGTAFSVNLQVPFVSLVESENQPDDRIPSFLEKVELKKHMVTIKTDFNVLDYSVFQNLKDSTQKLDCLRKISIDFLSKGLSKDL